jgi:hypothetical protein
MTPPARFAGVLVVAASAAAFAAPAAATGPRTGEKNLQQTYPLASRLCTEIATGTGKPRPHLRPFATQILADCTTLQNGFNAARSTLLTTKASIASARAADEALAANACAGTAAKTAACAGAQHTEGQLLRALNVQLKRAVHVYYVTIVTDGKAFWHAIRALPGSRVREDKIPVQPV